MMPGWCYRVRRRKSDGWRRHQQQLTGQTRSTDISRDSQASWRHNEAQRLAAHSRRHDTGGRV